METYPLEVSACLAFFHRETPAAFQDLDFAVASDQSRSRTNLRALVSDNWLPVLS